MRLEQIRQLGARLRCFIEDMDAFLPEMDLPRRQRVERYILGHYNQQITLRDLAKELCLSSERTRHYIVMEFGTTFRQLVHQTRLTAAAAFLLNTDLPVANIGYLCGITDPSAFSRAFRTEYGLPPGAWRKVRRA
jgi:AraC-like DNA-binding protein